MDTWLSGWRTSLRMARFDARRYRGRAALILVMIGLPVFVLVGGLTVWASADISHTEALTLQMGRAQAVITRESSLPVVQDIWAGARSFTENTAEPATPATPQASGAELAKILGADPITSVSVDGRVVVEDREPRAQTLIIDAARPALAGKVALLTGRWPQRADEVLVTTSGAAAGIPTTGTLAYAQGDGPTTTLTIVGTGTAYESEGKGGEAYDLVRPPAALATGVPDQARYRWIIDRPIPVTWQDVRALNRHGFLVVSRSVIADPPDTLSLTAEERALIDDPDTQGRATALVAALLSVALMIEMMLLAGPAFSVSAARQRHTLALFASNGGSPRHVRRIVLGQALFLGVGATVVGALAGLLAAFGIHRVLVARTLRPLGDYELPVVGIIIMVVVAVISSVVSALLPSRALGRLDLVSILRGQSVSPKLHRGMPVLGLALCGTAVAVTVVTAVKRDLLAEAQGYLLAVAAVMLVVGALCLVPTILTVVGAVTDRAPLSLRMATRDAARQRGRATSTVASILGGAVLASGMGIGIASEAARLERQYEPRAPLGWIQVTTLNPETDLPRAIAVAQRVTPELTAVPFATLGQQPPPPGAASGTASLAVIVRPGCTLAQALTATPDDDPSCVAPGEPQGWAAGQIGIADASYLATSLGLGPAETAALAKGAVILPDAAASSPDGAPIGTAVARPGSKVTVALVSVVSDTDLTVTGTPRLHQAPAIIVPRARFMPAFPSAMGPVGAAVPAAMARQWTAPTTSSAVLFHPSDGSPASDATVQRLTDAISGWSDVRVERGYQSGDERLIIGIGIGIIALLILVATLVATAMATAEREPLNATLAAVGATRTTRRKIAAYQAASLAAIGTVLGLLVGAAPGVALAWITTGTDYMTYVMGSMVHIHRDPLVAVPWLPLIALAIGAPTVAAALAWFGIRRAPDMTRRLT